MDPRLEQHILNGASHVDCINLVDCLNSYFHRTFYTLAQGVSLPVLITSYFVSILPSSLTFTQFLDFITSVYIGAVRSYTEEYKEDFMDLATKESQCTHTQRWKWLSIKWLADSMTRKELAAYAT